MSVLDEVLEAAAANPERAVFISRRGEPTQIELAKWIAERLAAHGYVTILQDLHFQHTNFMLAMDGALASGARVLGLLSREYLGSQDCMLEATTAMRKGRLILLNIDGCDPSGVLQNQVHVPFLPVWQTGDAGEMERVILATLADPAKRSGEQPAPVAVGRAQTIHSQILMHDEAAFAGRDTELARLKELLWAGGSAALTRAGARGLVDEAALAGMGGVGKTTLARAYAFRHRGDYHGVWWVRAETAETLIDDLIELGARDMPGLERWEDPEAAARETLRLIATRATGKPWLIVYDNAPGEGAVKPWRPQSNAHVIVTSRNPNWTAAVELDVFTPEAAVDFLCETAGRGQPSDREDAAALAAQLGYLPLALAHAGSHCQIRLNPRITFAAYSRRLTEFWDEKPDAADSVHGRYATSVLATFSLALDDIVAGRPDGDPAPCPEAETVMGVLAHLAPEQVPEFLLRPLFAGAHAVMPEAAFDRALKALAAGALATWGAFEDGAPHLSVHRLVQEIMRARLAAAGRAAACAELAVTSINRTFDASGAMSSIATNARWLPHAKAVLAHAPRDGGAAYHTLWTQLLIGDLEVARGSLAAALAAYEDARGLAERLAKPDPTNQIWQRELAVTHSFVGNVQVARGNLSDALAAYRTSNEIVERLAAADPGNAGWQRDLSVSHNKIGDVPQNPGKSRRGAGRLQCLTRHTRAPRRRRSRQRRMAARSLRQPGKDRRRALSPGKSHRGPGRLQSLPRHKRTPRRSRSRQCRMAARPLRLSNEASATC